MGIILVQFTPGRHSYLNETGFNGSHGHTGVESPKEQNVHGSVSLGQSKLILFLMERPGD